MHPVTPAGALVGRESEMSLLTGMVKEVSLGRGGVVLIEGEPGSHPWLTKEEEAHILNGDAGRSALFVRLHAGLSPHA